jgi:hypothetical protein
VWGYDLARKKVEGYQIKPFGAKMENQIFLSISHYLTNILVVRIPSNLLISRKTFSGLAKTDSMRLNFVLILVASL